MNKQLQKQKENFVCSHGHTGFEHPSCFNYAMLSGKIDGKNQIAFIDIETTNLVATYGWMISWAIKPLNGKPITGVVKPREVHNGTVDKRICKEFIEAIKPYNFLVGHYSERFDLPYLRTRCLLHKIPFPIYGEKFHKDTWRIIRGKLKLHSNRLETICDFLGIESKEHRLNTKIWQQATAGRPYALNYIRKHNIEDVISTEKVFKRIIPYTNLTKTSI